MGTSVGTLVFVQYGWRACSLLMLALYGFQLGMLVLRGPHCPRNHWFGWMGGFEVRKSVAGARKRDDATNAATPIEEPQPLKTMEEGSRQHKEPGDAANAA